KAPRPVPQPGGRAVPSLRHNSRAGGRRWGRLNTGVYPLPPSPPEKENPMARTDAIVLGAGIVGISAALHLAKRGLAVALVDRRGPAEETSYGNTGIIEGNTLFAHAFPKGFGALLRIALKQAPEANYHLAALPGLTPWLLAYRASTRGERAMEF